MIYNFSSFLYLLLLPLGKEIKALHVKVNEPVIIDGILKESIWRRSDSILLFDTRSRTKTAGIVKTAWDKKNLYISFEVTDQDLRAKQNTTDHPELYLDDMVEFLIDTENKKDSCWSLNDIIYHINILGKKKDDRGSTDCITNPKWNGNAAYSIRKRGSLNDSTDVDTGYIVETAISWKELKRKPSRGVKLGINFAIGDQGRLFDWVGASPFRSPYKFGNIVLE